MEGKDQVKYIDHMNTFERMLKRWFDVLLSCLAICLSFPLALIIAVLIKQEGGGPVLYRQERIGYKGRPFYMYKFRTMVKNSDEDDSPQLCKVNDERLTPRGLFIREHHLDELPQLWNILKGDMSFVGPRPERRYFIDIIQKHNPDYVYLYRMRPGVFSKATLYNGYTDTLDKMLRRLSLDLEYLVTRSLLGDLKIIVLTVYFILSGRKF